MGPWAVVFKIYWSYVQATILFTLLKIIIIPFFLEKYKINYLFTKNIKKITILKT